WVANWWTPRRSKRAASTSSKTAPGSISLSSRKPALRCNAMLTRRSFLNTAAIAALPAHAASRARVDSVAIISRQPEFYHGWPTLAQRKNGQLLVACSGGREAHVCPFGRVELIRSSDGGRTWSWPEVIMDTAIDDRDAGVFETPAGSLLVTTFTSLAYQPVLD